MNEELFTTIERALAAGPVPGLVSAYLFGSHAQGRAHRESDVDIGVLLAHDRFPDARSRFEARIALSAVLGAALQRDDIDVVVLNDVPALLGRHVVTSGRSVLCVDPESDHAFVRDVQLRAADLAPFLRRMQHIKLAALTR